MHDLHTRRGFIQKTIVGTGSLIVDASFRAPDVEACPPAALPRRKLGRTGVEISIIGMGLASLGMAHYSPEEFRSTAEVAVAEGVNYFDVQPNYGDAEKCFAPVLRRHRDQIFVVTKTWEKARDGVLQSVSASLERLAVPSVDAVLLNNIGLYDLDRLFAPDGALAGLKELRRRGQARFLGLSGHMGPRHFVQALQSGEFDIVMAPFNFVDPHIYTFERDILPVAEKHGVGVVAMKALGGAVGLKYDTRQQKAMLRGDDYELALRYVLGLPGMCSAVIGCKNAAEIRLAARTGRKYRPLSDAELAALEARGRQLAAQWGKRYPEG